MKTYSISPNSYRIDKTNFTTKDEAISRAQECARILNRGISVYEVDEPGTNTQEKDYPKVTSPIVHIAFVLPDGSVKKGDHPAIELLAKDPEAAQLPTYPYALGSLSSLVRTLDVAAKHPALPKEMAKEIFAIADTVQNRVIASQASVNTLLVNDPESFKGLAVAFTTGTVFHKADSDTTVKIVDINADDQLVTFASTASSRDTTPRTIQTKMDVLAKVLLSSGFEISPAEQDAMGYGVPNPTMQPAVHTPKEDAKHLEKEDEKKTLSEQLGDAAAEDTNTLLAYCVELCEGNIYDADELATAFVDAFNTKTENRLTTAAQLKVMTTFCKHQLPANWFVQAQRIALRELTTVKQSKTFVPPAEVQTTAAAALKAAQERGVKLPKLAKSIATRLANGDVFDDRNFERVRLYQTTATSNKSALEHAAWGGDAGKNWVALIKSPYNVDHSSI